jgi:hypothetical protein
MFTAGWLNGGEAGRGGLKMRDIERKLIRRVGLAAVVAVGLLAASAERAMAAAFYSGNDLLRICTDNNVGDQNVCQGFVIGVADQSPGQKRSGKI